MRASAVASCSLPSPPPPPPTAPSWRPLPPRTLTPGPGAWRHVEAPQELEGWRAALSPLGWCCPCGRRHLLAASAAAALLPVPTSRSCPLDPMVGTHQQGVVEKFHPARPVWYEEFYAQALKEGMRAYEAEVAGYKTELFSRLRGKSERILELGVGTGPNFKFYASAPGVHVIGVDPQKQMEKYAREAAVAAGLPSTSFTFLRAVGEALPVADNSLDAVIGTLVLCSVKDVELALREVKRVLKPGGLYLFIEHVAARDGSPLRFVQTVLDPLQQFVADGCHLTRETGKSISEAGFSTASINMAFLSTISLISPHVYGFACK